MRRTNLNNLSALAHLFVRLSCFLAFIRTTSAMTKTTMNDFFPEAFKHGNLSEITWDHAVNSKRLLAEALANEKHMIEADVLLGVVINQNGKADERELITVIMGHPPAILSDLSLQGFMDAIVAHNAAPGTRKKGVKLDFKRSDAYAKAMSPEILLNVEGNAFKPSYSTFPLWINGDIAKGPGHPSSNGVDLKLDAMKSKPEVMDAVIWSLGWTTGDYQESETYTMEQITAMKATVSGMGNVTFPVRAMYAAKSRNAMDALLAVGTLTIWSGQQDDRHVDVIALAKLIRDHLDSIYVDVPDTLWQRIVTAMNQL